MPGTTYTRSGPERDSAGRFADFARFAVAELEELEQLTEATPPELRAPRRAVMHAHAALLELRDVARLLEGFTTADD